MKDSKSLQYFRVSFQKWFEKSGLKQHQAATRLEVSQSLITKFLRGETGLSFSQADNIALNLKKSLIEMLLEGKEIIDGSKHEENTHFTNEQKEALEAFKICLLYGGETSEMIANNAIELARKKQGEVRPQNNPKSPQLKSA